MMDVIPPETTMNTKPMRSAGGHIHVGCKFAQKDPLNVFAIIRMMDLFVGLPSIYLDHDRTSKKRKELYGQAGRFRAPKHGAEYRTLSNFWISSPKMVGLIYDLTTLAVAAAQDQYETWWNIDRKTLSNEKITDREDFDRASCHVCAGYDITSLRCAIDNMDRQRGKELMEFFKGLVPSQTYAEFEKLSTLKETPDLYREWNLG
jgi:hypothetical protein